jgi:MoxR-like ATPase
MCGRSCGSTKPSTKPLPMSSNNLPSSVDEVMQLLASQQYVAERQLATTLYLALTMRRPLFLEGEAGVGKTEIAKVLASSLGRKLVRLQCYEGLDISSAVYEWNYPRQMIEIRLAEAAGETSKDQLATDIFTDRFLIKRPLLQALEHSADGAPILLIDELDRTDEPFEAYLLEMLAEYQVSIPEIGTIKADEPPLVIITSNRTREIHDAVKRRCFYHWVDYPDKARELEIIRRKVPQAAETLSRQVVAFIARLRQMELYKLPGVAETIDWTASLTALDKLSLDPESVTATLGVVLKYQDDIGKMDAATVTQMVEEVRNDVANS